MNRVTTTANLLTLAAFALANVTAAAGTEAPATAPADEKMVLEGGEEGTVFKSLTVTGEDRIRVEFERPELRVDVDPRTAPGLEWGDPMDVLKIPAVDLVGPLTAQSAVEPSPHSPRPWIDRFRAEAVARFHPELKDVADWRLIVADSRSDTVATFQGKGNPPKEISWNGLSRDGTPVPPGVTCSYVLEATDRAGNRRSFVGEGFELPSYRVDGRQGTTLLFAGPATNAVLLDVATNLDQVRPGGGPVEVKVAAPSASDAQTLAAEIVGFLQEHTLGDPARIRPLAEVRADAPPAGAVAVVARHASAAAPEPKAKAEPKAKPTSKVPAGSRSK